MYAAIAFFVIILSPLFPPVAMAGADAVKWIYVRIQKLVRKQSATAGPSTDGVSRARVQAA